MTTDTDLDQATPRAAEDADEDVYDSFDAQLLAKIDGVKLSVGYHNPFLVSQPDLIWLVLKGSVDIYAVPLVDGAVAGTGRHLMRVEAGDLIFGMPAIPADGIVGATGSDPRIGLRAVASMGTKLFRARRADIEQDDFDLIVVDWIDRWIGQIADVITPPTLARPTALLEAEPGIDYPAQSILCPQQYDTIWLASDSGAFRLLDHDQLVVSPGVPAVPLAGRMWASLSEPATLSAVYTPTALLKGELWSNLDQFHDIAMIVVRDRLTTERAEEEARLRQKLTFNQGLFSDALGRISAVLAQPDQTAVLTAPQTGSLLHAACSLVGDQLGVKIAPARHGTPTDTIFDLAEIARRSRVRTRRVILAGDWYNHDSGPMVAFLVDGTPVALLQEQPARYLLVEPATGERRRVTAQVAEELSGEAYVLYRPFPSLALRVRDVLAFGARNLMPDFRIAGCMGLLTGILALVIPIATGELFSSVIPNADLSMHVSIVLGLVMAAVGTAVFSIARGFSMLRIQAGMDSSIQTAVWDRLLALPAPFFRRFTAGDLADRANSINAIREILTSTAVQSMLDAIFSIFSLLLLFWYSWELAFAALGLVFLLLLVTGGLTAMQMQHQRALAAMAGKLEGIVFQMLSGLSKLRMSASEPRAFARWSRHFSERKEVTYRIRRIAAVQQVLTAFFPVLSSIVIFAFVYYVLNAPDDENTQKLGVGEFLAFNAAFGQFSASVMSVVGALTTMIAVVPLYERVDPILKELPESSEEKADPGQISGSIEFSRVVFHYNEDGPPIINDLSLQIEAGGYVAFVGASGSGKSTLLRLLLGFEQPKSGGIYIDGKDLSGIDLGAFRRQIGVVLQNGRLMSGSIYENIVGSLPLSLETAWEAARLAGLDGDIKDMPMGMQTVLSEGAGTLSGGQKQRLMIARALVHKPRILVLDEATSALDNRTQAIVNESISRLKMTRIVVAHRLSTIVNAQKIYVLKQGRIVESGDFKSLMAKEGEFAALARRQIL